MLLNILEYVFLNNPLKNFIWFLVYILLGFVVSSIIVFLSKTFLNKITAKTKTKIDDIISNILSKPLPLKIFIVTIFFNIGFKYLIVSDWWTVAIKEVSFTVYVFAITLFIIKFCLGLVNEYLVPHTKKTDSLYDDQLIPLLKSLIKVIFFVLAVLIILSNFGYNINALLAGLGIGGLAVALASKDALENFLSGIVIFIEKPFKMGDTLKTNDFFGTVEEIGIRSTKIRTSDNTLVIVPNKILSLNSVENVSARKARRENFTIGLPYNTSLKKIEVCKKILFDILIKNTNVESSTINIAFESFGDYSLNIRIIYWIFSSDFKEYLQTKDQINLSIKKEFEKAKIEFAFPIQKVFLEK